MVKNCDRGLENTARGRKILIWFTKQVSCLSLCFSTAHFKTHTPLELNEYKRIPRQVVMLEHKSGNVLAINQDDDTVIAKV